MLGLKGELWVFRKYQKILTASDQYFVKQSIPAGGGGQTDPSPPTGIGLTKVWKMVKAIIFCQCSVKNMHNLINHTFRDYNLKYPKLIRFWGSLLKG